MSVEINVTGEVVTAYLKGEIDHHSASEIRQTIDSAVELNMPSLLVLDFSAVSFMDSSGVGLILGRAELCEEIGSRIRLKGMSSAVMKIVRLSGVEKIKNLSISDV